MPLRPVALALTILSTLGSVACGGSSDEGDDPSGLGGAEADGGGGDTGGGAPGDNPCGLDTIYKGDDKCIPAPDPEEGLQFHIGPESYDNPDELGEWLLMPGDEPTECYHMLSPNTEGHHYFKQQYRMRDGSHHMILMRSDNTDPEAGWGKCKGGIVNSIGGTQHVIEDLPPGGIVAPEDEGLGRYIEPQTPSDFSLHFYNFSDEVRLREAWVNFLYKPDEEVTTNLGMLGGFVINMNIPPQTSATVGNTCKAEHAIPAGTDAEPIRIVTLFAHAHTHNKRFAVWHKDAAGNEEIVYDSYDGADAPTYTYNSIAEIPLADPAARISGGRSGLLTLRAGEQLRFSCDIVNDTTNFTFTGANEVNSDEMCNLFGSVAGLGFPCFDLSRLQNPPKPPAAP